jgi:hypothetical protein
MTDWNPIETAPKDRSLLLFGEMKPFDGLIGLDGPIIFTGYWDSIDEAWCSSGSTWLGPFYRPTHWQPLPARPSPPESAR